ncbi:SMI1/KNR4 family protein [Roseateles chitinivorans]|uniref:SMI1/KNR4 family protein n=1 Tax=Roseateles chitinivorans TaxID=2917965 RepID=UPI003D67F854
MQLLSIDQIREKLDLAFLPLEPALSGLRLIEGGASSQALDTVETTLGMLLPSDFRQLVQTYDFGRLTVGPVAFGYSGSYPSELLDLNRPGPASTAGLKQAGLLLIAHSDPYRILLRSADGAVLASDVELPWPTAERVASSFLVFLRGVGTVLSNRVDCNDRVALAQNVAALVAAESFEYWRQLAA